MSTLPAIGRGTIFNVTAFAGVHRNMSMGFYSMAQADSDELPPDDLDAFFDAADQDDLRELQIAARSVALPRELRGSETLTHPAWGGKFVEKAPSSPQPLPDSDAAEFGPALPPPVEEEPPQEPRLPRVAEKPAEAKPKRKKKKHVKIAGGGDATFEIPADAQRELTEFDADDMDGKYIAIDPDAIPGVGDSDQPFVLIPANVHTFMPWWGWATIILGLSVMITGVVLMPGITLDRLTSRLGDRNEAVVQGAMRQLVLQGDERTVKKLYGMAASRREGLPVRLRAVDTMSLIERVPEVDRALLRLELSAETHDQVREAAIAARRQREAYRTRGRR